MVRATMRETLRRWTALTLLLASPLALAEGAGAAVEKRLELPDLASLTAADRRALVKAIPREELSRALEAVPAETLLEIGRKALGELGTYRVRLTKAERISGELLPSQVMELEIRESPRAIRGEVVGGPAKGRKLLYNQKLRAKELRVREAGLLRFAGAVWLDLDSSLAKKDTTHAITDLGYGALLELLGRDLEKGKAFGGHSRKDEGFDHRGSWCIRFTAPQGGKGLYADEALVCFEPASGLMSRIEVSDGGKVKERFEYELLDQGLSLKDEDFTPDAFGL